MASGTGVGGVKDSQGNFEIIGRDNSSVGTRGGTFLVPVGDVIGQTSGTLAVNVYTASNVINPEVIALNVQEFVPGTPPGAPFVASSLTLSTEDVRITAGGGSVALEPVTVSGSIGNTFSFTISAPTIVLETGSSGNVIGNQATTGFDPSLAVITVLTAYINNFALSQSFIMPFDGDIVDVIVASPPNGSTTTVNRVVPSVGTFNVATLVAGAPDSLLRLATFGSANGASFQAGDTLSIAIGAVPFGSVRVCVHIIRTTPVI